MKQIKMVTLDQDVVDVVNKHFKGGKFSPWLNAQLRRLFKLPQDEPIKSLELTGGPHGKKK